MVKVALLVRLEAKPGKESAVEEFLRSGLALVQEDAGEVRGLAVHGEDVARHIVAGAHTVEDVGVGFGDRSELRVPVLGRSGDFRDRDIVDHPTFIPTALIVNDKQRRNVSEDIVEGSW